MNVLHRSIRFFFNSETEVEGVPGYEYILDETMVQNATYREENECFNSYPAEDLWLPNGKIN